MDEQELAPAAGQLKQILECMLFVSPQPLSISHVSRSLGLDELIVDQAIHELRLDYAGRGLHILRVAEGYQMCTRPEYAHYISLLLKPQRSRLSRAALETIAIVAYRQPITQPEIEAIRGVNSDGVLKTLMDKNLIKQVGKKETPGRPTLYATTDEFLCHFGLNDLSQLPELTDVTLPESESSVSQEASTEDDNAKEDRGSEELQDSVPAAEAPDSANEHEPMSGNP